MKNKYRIHTGLEEKDEPSDRKRTKDVSRQLTENKIQMVSNSYLKKMFISPVIG